MSKISSSFSVLFLALPLVAATGTIQCLNNRIHDFELVDTSVTPPILTDLTPVVDLSDFPTCTLNIQANVRSTPSNCDEGTIKCVKFFLDDEIVNKEKFPPFTLFGDVPGESIKSVKPPIGTTTIKACTYTDKRCSIGEQGCMSMTVDFLDCNSPITPVVAPVEAPVVAPVEAPVEPIVDTPVEAPVEAPVAEPTSCNNGNEIVGFELVDAENPRAPIVMSFSPPIINLMDFPTCELNIFAVGRNNTCGNPPIACVRVSLGSSVRRERYTPYALFGDRTGRIVYDRKPELGQNTLKACTYTDRDCRVDEQGCLEVDVNVQDCMSMSM
jgi:hypothetical protein